MVFQFSIACIFTSFRVPQKILTYLNSARRDELNGSVLLYCEVEFVPHNIKCVNYKNQIVNNQINERNLLKNLFLDKTLSDFVIKIRNEKINVHRCILAQNSSVFLTMFEQNMIEARNGELEIVDSSPECFKAMIEYFYLGQINSSNILETNVDDLYAIAHKYCVDSLMNNVKLLCLQILVKLIHKIMLEIVYNMIPFINL
uniref:BTB domain-containing protein n=1 Tax=Meloidogyne incognita TaxID=6306 RepID=A0A914M720_MELIC